jgi:Ca2+/H+ antiporter
MDMLNGVTAVCVVQALTFVYWSQTDDFKDSVKFGGHIAALLGILLFLVLYCIALYVITSSQVDLIAQAFDQDIASKTKLTPQYLKDEAWHSLSYRIGVVFVFHILSIVALLRYFSGRYTLPKDRSPGR